MRISKFDELLKFLSAKELKEIKEKNSQRNLDINIYFRSQNPWSDREYIRYKRAAGGGFHFLALRLNL